MRPAIRPTSRFLLAGMLATVVSGVPAAVEQLPSATLAPLTQPDGSEEEGSPDLLRLGWIEGTLLAGAEMDVRVNDPAPRAGDMVACHIQSETTLVATGPQVFIAFNDTRQCVDGLGLPVVPRSAQGLARSDDGGVTFEDLGPVMPSGPIASLTSDPVLALDREGRLFMASMAGGALGELGGPRTRTIAVGVTTDRGDTFEWHDAAGGTADFPGTHDKPWIAVDTTGGLHDGTVYVTWTDFEAHEIRLSRSEDAGRTWSAPITLGSGAVNGSRPAVAPDGSVLVVWLERLGGRPYLVWTRSTDWGRTFPPAVRVLGKGPVGTAGCVANAYRVVNGDMRVYEMPAVAFDGLGSSNPTAPDFNAERGTAYVVMQMDGAGADQADVFLTRLAPGATQWSPFIRVNDDATTADQLFPEVAVPGPGRVAVAWTDRREDPANLSMRQHVAISEDGGRTFGPAMPFSDVLFPPPRVYPVNSDPGVAPCYAGDYNALWSDGAGQLLAAWGDNRDRFLVGGVPGVETHPDPNVYFRRAGSV